MKAHVLVIALGLCAMESLAVGKEVHWTDAKAGIRIGVEWEKWETGNGVIRIHAGSTTNYANNLICPPSEQMFEYLSLKGMNGKVVKLTEQGQRYRARLETRMTRRRQVSRQLRFYGNNTVELADFFIDRVYAVPEAGEYELEIRVRMLKEDGKALRPVIYDPIKLRLHLSPLPIRSPT